MGQFCFLLRYLHQPQKKFVIVIPDHEQEVQSRGSGCGPTSTPQSIFELTAAIRAGITLRVSLVHNALQDGGKWCDANACPDQDGMLGGKDLSCRSPVWSIYITLKCGTESLNERQRSSWILLSLCEQMFHFSKICSVSCVTGKSDTKEWFSYFPSSVKKN